MIKVLKLLILGIYYNYIWRLKDWIYVSNRNVRKYLRGSFRKVFTFACEVIYKHPTLYKIADHILCRNSPEWRKITGGFVENGGKVLELGCGRFPAITNGLLLDSSLPLLKEAPAQFLKICSTANYLPFRDKSFDTAISVFPPGIGADEGFFQEKKFWQEIHRVLTDEGKYISLIYINYNSWFSRISSKILDPLLRDFWDNLRKIAEGFEISSNQWYDNKKNRLVFVKAEKKNPIPTS